MRMQTPVDVYSFVNEMSAQLTGQKGLTAVDTSSFVSVGESILNHSFENVCNALSIVVARTIGTAKQYNARFNIIMTEDVGAYSDRVRKVSAYSKKAEPASMENTNLYPKNLYDGYSAGAADGATTSQWLQSKPVLLELNFGGRDVYRRHITIYPEQLKIAFRSESDFIAIWDVIFTEFFNDIEQDKESRAEATVLNMIGGTLALNAPGSVQNLTKIFNDRYGTTYTNRELLGEQLTKFAPFAGYVMTRESDFMTERSLNYHISPTKIVDGVSYNALLRHTPKADQRLILYSPLFEEMRATVFPQIFNPNFIVKPENAELITRWQAIKDADNAANDGIDARMKVKIERAAIPNLSDLTSQTSTSESIEANVVGILYDKDAMLAQNVYNNVYTTNIEASKGYSNTFYHFAFNSINDYTENCCVFIMDDTYLTQA